MKHPRATAWGAGVMGVAGLFGAVLGPSPLVLPFVPLIPVAHVPFALVMGAVGLAERTRGKPHWVVAGETSGAKAGRQ